ncbi:hypothetical protein DPMN_165959 [Dreissena polymorpha]|uniref:Uncharacterized protein n=1 Tax=Dreissena polymorpha TaxID=45954 RepID=A0A9D4F183_DREPO|nr:hypothetical protein DPMN_165959 [Dreissena polymorpha]
MQLSQFEAPGIQLKEARPDIMSPGLLQTFLEEVDHPLSESSFFFIGELTFGFSTFSKHLFI